MQPRQYSAAVAPDGFAHRTNAQKREAVVTLLRMRPDLPNALVADRCGVSLSMVRRRRASMTADGGGKIAPYPVWIDLTLQAILDILTTSFSASDRADLLITLQKVVRDDERNSTMAEAVRLMTPIPASDDLVDIF